jgi:hypothetical protein
MSLFCGCVCARGRYTHGSVTLKDGATALGTVTLVSGGGKRHGLTEHRRIVRRGHRSRRLNHKSICANWISLD